MGGRGIRRNRTKYHYTLLRHPPFVSGGQKDTCYFNKYRHNFKYIDKNGIRIQQEREDDQKQPCVSPTPTPTPSSSPLVEEQVRHIPDEVILEILYKLPLRAQIMFKLVSKGWLDMISNPRRIDSCLSYRMNRYLLSPDTLYGLFCYPAYHDDGFRFFPLKTYSDSHNLEDAMILGRKLDNYNSCGFNKMYTLKATSSGFLLFTLEIGTLRQFVICNPYTKETRVVATLRVKKLHDYFYERRNYLAAMGFYCHIDRTSPNLAHYTVVLLYQDRETGISNLKICSSRTKGRPRWRDNYTKLNCEICLSSRYDGYSSAGSYGDYFRSDKRSPVGFLNGVFYCTGSAPTCCGLIAYDLSPDKLEETHIPLPVAPECREVCVCVSSDHRFFCCGLIVEYNDTSDTPNYRDSRTYTLQLSVSKEDPRVSDNDFGWQTEYIMELDCSVDKLKGFDPRNPRIVFFTTFTWEPYADGYYSNYRCTCDLKCYDFQKQEVTSMGFDSHTSKVFSGQPSLLPCERLPWPVSLHR